MTETPPTEKFESPYPRGDACERIHAWIAKDDILYVRLLRPQLGTFTFVIGHLWKKLTAELRSRGVVDHTQCEEFESFVTTAKIIPLTEYESLVRDATHWRNSCNVPGRPSPGVNTNPNGTNAGKRVKSVRRVPTAESKERTDVPGDDKEGK